MFGVLIEHRRLCLQHLYSVGQLYFLFGLQVSHCCCTRCKKNEENLHTDWHTSALSGCCSGRLFVSSHVSAALGLSPTSTRVTIETAADISTHAGSYLIQVQSVWLHVHSLMSQHLQMIWSWTCRRPSRSHARLWLSEYFCTCWYLLTTH